MRLNDFIPDVNKPESSDAQSLLKKVIDRVTLSLAIDPKRSVLGGRSSESVNDFFENYYTKPDLSGVVEGIEIEYDLSLIESEILNFFVSKNSDVMPFVFVDHAGRGKSTILKYICYYLCRKEKNIDEIIRPIYISLREHEIKIQEIKTANELHLFIDKLIKESIYKLVVDYLKEDHHAILLWLNTTYQSDLQARYPAGIIDKIDDIETHLSELAEKNKGDLVTLIVGTMCHYSINRRSILLILDDADNFDIDTQRALLQYASHIIPWGVKVLVSIRNSTWRSMEADRRDYEVRRSTPIHWSLDQLKSLLIKRLSNANKIQVRSKTLRTEASPSKIVNSFIALLENNQTSDFLIRTSNYNLHSLMRKLLLMPSSWHFNDRYLLREQLIDKVTLSETPGIPLWSTFNLVLGCHRGTYKGGDDMVRNGLLNCFCTRDDKHAYYTFFVRMHIISRLRKNDTEITAVPIREMYDEYKAVFSSNLGFTKVFNRTLFRLIQGGLVHSNSCRRYQSLSEVEEHINDDSVFISDSGIYYTDWLFSRVDYLYFMKDDIDWREECDISGLNHVKIGEGPFNKHKNTLKALYKLMKLELRMLTKISEEMKGASIASSYITLFSAESLSKGKKEILFTKVMRDEFKLYLDRVYKGRKEVFSKEWNAINTLLEDYSDIRTAFS